jgi:hypothetical protein
MLTLKLLMGSFRLLYLLLALQLKASCRRLWLLLLLLRLCLVSSKC